MSDWNTRIIEEFRGNDGKVGGMFDGWPLLLLYTVGARSGQPRVNPLAYQAVYDLQLACWNPRIPEWIIP